MGITNFNSLIFFDWCGYNTAERVLPFRQGGGSGVFVRRSVTYDYKSYCLSGKGEAVN
jgi:hypothetical protein